MSNNEHVAGMLRQIGVLLEEEGEAFKPAAYRRAAQVIQELPWDVCSCADVNMLLKLPGIGKAIAGKIIEFCKTGRMRALDALLRKRGGIPPQLMNVENVGPKRARQISQALGITTVEQLIAAAEAGKLRSLPRMSALLEKKILASARRVHERTKRFPRADIQHDVEQLLAAIRNIPGIRRAEVAGSYRRKQETVGDVDILAVASAPRRVAEAIIRMPMVRNVVAHGPTKVSFDLQSGIRVDIRFVKASQWGAALLYFTGSREHNIALRNMAIRHGWKLNEYGLFRGKQVVAGKTEEEIYAALGLPIIPPEQRTGSVVAAR